MFPQVIKWKNEGEGWEIFLQVVENNYIIFLIDVHKSYSTSAVICMSSRSLGVGRHQKFNNSTRLLSIKMRFKGIGRIYEGCDELVSNTAMTFLGTYNDIVDGDVDKFHEKSNEAHDCKSDGCCHGDLLEFSSVRFCASFDETNGVFCKLFAWLEELHDLIHI